MPDRAKVIAWLADEELYYRDHGDTHNSLMACNAISLLKEQNCNCCGTVFDVAYKAGKADAVVRCRDCRFFTEPDSHGDQCAKIHWSRGADWFCADGEAKT